MQNTVRRVGQQQVTRFIGRHSRITSHSIPALSRVRRHHHRLARHYLARANVGAGFPHCPGVHGCIRPVTPSRPGLPHHISLNWEPSTLACRCCCTMTREGIWVLTRNCNTIIDISWLSHHTFGSPPCQLLARHESESGCLLACCRNRKNVARLRLPGTHCLNYGHLPSFTEFHCTSSSS